MLGKDEVAVSTVLVLDSIVACDPTVDASNISSSSSAAVAVNKRGRKKLFTDTGNYHHIFFVKYCEVKKT